MGGSIGDALGSAEFRICHKDISAYHNGKFFPVRGYGDFTRTIVPTSLLHSRYLIVHDHVDGNFFRLLAGHHGVDFAVVEEAEHVIVGTAEETHGVFREAGDLCDVLRIA